MGQKDLRQPYFAGREASPLVERTATLILKTTPMNVADNNQERRVVGSIGLLDLPARNMQGSRGGSQNTYVISSYKVIWPSY